MAPRFGDQDGSGDHPGATNDCNSFFGGDDSNTGCNSNPASDASNASFHVNVPMLALGLALTAFLLVCFSVCLCTYRRARARNSTIRTRVPQEMERGVYVGLGLGLEDRHPVVIVKEEDKGTNVDDHPPPAYSPKPSPSPSIRQHQPSNLTLGARPSIPTPLLSLSPSPALAGPVSPAFSSYTLSRTLPQGENEEARLLGGRRALTPPPPTYAR